MFLIFIIAVAAMGGFEYAPPLWIGGLVLMGILIFSTIIYQFAIKAPAERKKAEEIQKKARQALRTSKSINKSETGIKKGQFALYCKFCGAPIEENAQSCKYCGMNWKWK
jgi:hypothetical protein